MTDLTKLIELQAAARSANSTIDPEFLIESFNFDFAALDAKIKRYEEALRFYADEDEYYFSAQDDDCGYSIVTREGDVVKDAGQRARKALEWTE